MLTVFDMNIKTSNRRREGMTLLETLVVLVLLAVLVAMLAPTRPRSRIACKYNLKQIGTAFRMWANDNSNAYPMEVSTNNGGSREFAFGPDVFRHFQAMQNELRQSPQLVLCPYDIKRFAATNFINIDNSNISYFVGITVSATNTSTDVFLSGDRNITNELGSRRGLQRLTTNDSAGWTIDNHGGADDPTGNILLSDGSVQQMNTSRLRQALKKPGVAPTVVAVP
jgi:prepilin-type N-terminal cleavage/methylation domain-containing protein